MLKGITDIFFDLDYTLLDFERGHQAAIESLGKKFSPDFAHEFDRIFHIILEGLRVQGDDWRSVEGGRASFDEIMEQARHLQGIQSSQIWSRELHAVIAAQRVNLSLSPAQCAEAAEHYWKTSAQAMTMYDDARNMLKKLEQLTLPYHLFTSSDGRLRWSQGRWQYDPDYSRQKKMERLHILPGKGIHLQSITIGDPLDKPDPAFYRSMINNASTATSRSVNPKQCIIVGDSFQGDVAAPVEALPFKSGYWIQRHGTSKKISDRIFKITKLTQIYTA